jgi:hypothetical protein
MANLSLAESREAPLVGLPSPSKRVIKAWPSEDELDAHSQLVIGAALATSSQASYDSGQSCFLAFVAQFKYHDAFGNPFPVTERTMLRFGSWLLGFDGKMESTVRAYTYAVQSLQVSLGYGKFTGFVCLERWLRGAKRLGVANRKLARPPITLDHLSKLFTHRTRYRTFRCKLPSRRPCLA